jgi:hypothetical protein
MMGNVGMHDGGHWCVTNVFLKSFGATDDHREGGTIIEVQWIFLG